MTREHAPRAQAHRGVALFIATLTTLIGLVALAPLTGVGQLSGQSTDPGNRLQAKGSVSRSSQPSSPQFLSAVTYNLGGSPQSVAVADMNGDGIPDLIVATCCDSNGDGDATILLGNGNGTFQTAVAHDSGGHPAASVAVADLLQGGGLQVVVANGCADQSACSGSGESGVGVLFGFFYPPAATYRSGGSEAQSVKIADVNNDGIPDLMVAHLCASTNAAKCTVNTPGSVGVLLGHDGIFTLVKTYNSGGFQTASLAVADVNGDGQPDLVVANTCASAGTFGCSNGSVGVLLGNGDGTFKKAVTYPAGFFPISVAVADVNGDGKPDLVVTNGQDTVGALLGNGDGTFASIVNYASGGFAPQSVAVADLNGDGKPDVLVSNSSSNNIGVLLGKGDGTFRAPLIYSTGGSVPLSVAIADVNGDGKPDLVVVNAGSNNVGVLLNNTGIHNPTSTSRTSSLNPSIYGEKVTWTATVTSSGSITPTGKVTFTWGNTIGTATLNASGVATLTKSNLNADSYPLVAVYTGDADNLSSTSAVLNQVVLETTSTTTLTSSPNPSTQGQAVTLTAKASSPTVTPTGPVTFTAGKTVLGTAQLSGGKAKLAVSSLAVGSTKVTATYYGDSNIAKSSASVIQTVQ